MLWKVLCYYKRSEGCSFGKNKAYLNTALQSNLGALIMLIIKSRALKLRGKHYPISATLPHVPVSLNDGKMDPLESNTIYINKLQN